MDIYQYIDSGILELYVLDQLNPSEKQEVESIAKEYPLVAEELISIVKTFQNIALKNKLDPNARIKAKIAGQLSFSDDLLSENKIENTASPTKIVSVRWYAISLVASLILLIISNFALWKTYNTLQDTQSKYLASLQDTKKYASQVHDLHGEYNYTLQNLTDTNTMLLRLNGTPHFPRTLVSLFWNKKNHTIRLIPSNLPQNNLNQSFQLWALINGVPHSLGIFDAQNQMVFLNKDFPSIQAFAITREPKGGSISPHLDQMVVIGMLKNS